MNIADILKLEKQNIDNWKNSHVHVSTHPMEWLKTSLVLFISPVSFEYFKDIFFIVFNSIKQMLVTLFTTLLHLGILCIDLCKKDFNAAQKTCMNMLKDIALFVTAPINLSIAFISLPVRLLTTLAYLTQMAYEAIFVRTHSNPAIAAAP